LIFEFFIDLVAEINVVISTVFFAKTNILEHHWEQEKQDNIMLVEVVKKPTIIHPVLTYFAILDTITLWLTIRECKNDGFL